MNLQIGRQAAMTLPLYFLGLTLEDVPEQDDWLSAAEKAVLANFRIAKRRNDWRLGRWTAKQAASVFLGRDCDAASLSSLEIRAAPDGAPEVFMAGMQAPASISISHSGAKSLCAVGDRSTAVGCDLERIELREDSFVADYFTAEEAALVDQAPASERGLAATLIWCAKESALKSLREGLRRDTRSIVVSIPERIIKEDWIALTVRCLESNVTLHGRWCVKAGFIQVITSALPVILRGL